MLNLNPYFVFLSQNIQEFFITIIIQGSSILLPYTFRTQTSHSLILYLSFCLLHSSLSLTHIRLRSSSQLLSTLLLVHPAGTHTRAFLRFIHLLLLLSATAFLARAARFSRCRFHVCSPHRAVPTSFSRHDLCSSKRGPVPRCLPLLLARLSFGHFAETRSRPDPLISCPVLAKSTFSRKNYHQLT